MTLLGLTDRPGAGWEASSSCAGLLDWDNSPGESASAGLLVMAVFADDLWPEVSAEWGGYGNSRAGGMGRIETPSCRAGVLPAVALLLGGRFGDGGCSMTIDVIVHCLPQLKAIALGSGLEKPC